MGLFARALPLTCGFPRINGGPAPALFFSRPAQRSLALQPAYLPSRLERPSTPEASTASLPPLLLRLLPGGANQFPGGSFPAVDQRLFTAHINIENYLNDVLVMLDTGLRMGEVLESLGF